MVAPENPSFSILSRGAIKWPLLLQCLFIVYGSFIPFDVNIDPSFARARFDRLLNITLDPGLWRFSTADLVSNVLLFVPFGFFLIGAEIGQRRVRGRSAAFLLGGFLGAIFGLIIELGQLLAPSRTPSVLDLVCNGAGTAIGACIGYILFCELRDTLETLLRQVADKRPSLFVLIFLLFAPIVSAYYPFDVTLDVSSVWGNLKRLELIPFKNGLHRSWPDLFLEKILVFGAISYIVKQNLPRTTPLRGVIQAWFITTTTGTIIETGKLLFVGRVPNVDNVVWVCVGAGLGATIIPFLASLDVVRRGENAILLFLAICVLGYFELQPFEWISARELSGRMSGIEWLPFAAYYVAHPQA